eukprot:8205509-Alexandrium_andersonii.AAC.1
MGRRAESMDALLKYTNTGCPESGRCLSAGSSGTTGFCGARGGSNRFAALTDGGCPCCPLEVEAETEAELMPLREGTRPVKPEFEGCSKVQVAIDSGAAAS